MGIGGCAATQHCSQRALHLAGARTAQVQAAHARMCVHAATHRVGSASSYVQALHSTRTLPTMHHLLQRCGGPVHLFNSTAPLANRWRATQPPGQRQRGVVVCMARPWRPLLDDVDRLSRGEGAKVRGTGCRDIPHRINAEERPAFDAAKKKVCGGVWTTHAHAAPGHACGQLGQQRKHACLHAWSCFAANNMNRPINAPLIRAARSSTRPSRCLVGSCMCAVVHV